MALYTHGNYISLSAQSIWNINLIANTIQTGNKTQMLTFMHYIKLRQTLSFHNQFGDQMTDKVSKRFTLESNSKRLISLQINYEMTKVSSSHTLHV